VTLGIVNHHYAYVIAYVQWATNSMRIRHSSGFDSSTSGCNSVDSSSNRVDSGRRIGIGSGDSRVGP
jgi:hypothetical protein